MAAATMSQISSPLIQRGGVASSSSRVRHTPTTCLMFRPRRCNPVPNYYAARPDFRPQAGRCGSNWAGGSAGFGAGPQVVWGAGLNNPQAWEQLLRMWGVDADPAKIREMMERGQSSWGNMSQVMEEATSAIILPIDVEDVGDSYHFIADVPGLEKGDIKIRVNQEERQLTISGERRRTEAPEGTTKSRRRSERRFGKFERKFKLPKDADLEAISARVEKGVLTLMVRKSEEARANERDVNID
ncbi:probable 17.9 kDa class II heat shock protein at C-terminar half [Coccomyxa sp. Obi]|nr:probable 17.9 kDa class II heat shock protein at C-terminar half [Coccomyxa sp. Obi]